MSLQLLRKARFYVSLQFFMRSEITTYVPIVDGKTPTP